MPLFPETKDQFKEFVDQVENGEGYERPAAFAFGLATVEGEGSDRTILDVQYIRRNYAQNFGTAAVLSHVLTESPAGLETGVYDLNHLNMGVAINYFAPFIGEPGHDNVVTLNKMKRASEVVYPDASTKDVANPRVPILGVVRKWEDDPVGVPDIYLRLYGLSDRSRLPNQANIEPGRDFGKLPNVVISEVHGTISVAKWNAQVEDMALQGLSTAVRVLDKFPRMLDHVVPTGVRIADPSRVRLGAYVGEGTTVMHEGFMNFNAGTLGTSMVEGRISAGVVVGKDSDIGGGASTQGTMSGGGKEKISIGERTLLEANSGTGISLGDDCRVEAGTYVKSTTLVKLPNGIVVKARELSGQNNMMLRRNSVTGEVELVPNNGTEWGGLNTALHTNQ